MSNDTKQKFDGYANQYDEWFMVNDKLFTSELELFKKVLGDITGKKLLSVGCGSGLFESYIDSSNIEGIEPSEDMAKIAEKRGINVIKYGLIEDVDLPDAEYDIIYFNGSSSYMEDLTSVYEKSLKAIKPGGKLILLDVPKESAFGFMYLLGKSLGPVITGNRIGSRIRFPAEPMTVQFLQHVVDLLSAAVHVFVRRHPGLPGLFQHADVRRSRDLRSDPGRG